MFQSSVLTALLFATMFAPVAGGASETCEYYDLNFDHLARGEYVTNQFSASHGVDISCTGGAWGCRVFDSAIPYGAWDVANGIDACKSSSCKPGSCSSSNKNKCGDPDLGTPNKACTNTTGTGFGEGIGGQPGQAGEICWSLGKLMVVDENGPTQPPDDRVGGTMLFSFDYPVDLISLDHMDNEAAETYQIYINKFDGSSANLQAAHTGNGGYALTDLTGQDDVTSLQVVLSGSGSINSIKYKVCTEIVTTTTTTTTTTSTVPATTTTVPATTTTVPATTTTVPATTTTVPATTTTTTTTNDNTVSHSGGDPHFARWGRTHDSFHGECDLLLVHSDGFHNGAGLDLQARTTIQDYFSYIEMAALRVGEHILEFHKDHFLLNGLKLVPTDLPLTVGANGYTYTISEPLVEEGKNGKFYQYYKVDLHQDSSILFRFYKQYLTMTISGNPKDFSDSVGLLGSFPTGEMIDRDGRTRSDFTVFGFEWQVSPTDAKLFQENRAPQLPYETCRMPTAARPVRRGLLRGADQTLYDQAVKACAKVNSDDFDLCTEDVMTTGDIGLATLW